MLGVFLWVLRTLGDSLLRFIGAFKVFQFRCKGRGRAPFFWREGGSVSYFMGFSMFYLRGLYIIYVILLFFSPGMWRKSKFGDLKTHILD